MKHMRVKGKTFKHFEGVANGGHRCKYVKEWTLTLHSSFADVQIGEDMLWFRGQGTAFQDIKLAI
jgi:hypothetical protein